MANNYDIFGIANPGTALTTAYSPGASSAFTGYVHVANAAGSALAFRVGAVPNGGGTAWLAYDVVIPANDALAEPIPVVLGPQDAVKVYGETSDVHFAVMGVEIS